MSFAWVPTIQWYLLTELALTIRVLDFNISFEAHLFHVRLAQIKTTNYEMTSIISSFLPGNDRPLCRYRVILCLCRTVIQKNSANFVTRKISQLLTCILSLLAEMLFAGNGEAEVNKLVHNVKDITASRNLESDTPHAPTCRQHLLGIWYCPHSLSHPC